LLVEAVAVVMIHLLVLVVLAVEQLVKMALAAVLVVVAHSQEVLDIQQAQHYKVELQTRQMVAVVVVVVVATGVVAQEAMVLPQTPAVAVVRAITIHRLLLQQH
jgi:hypothetical protein